MGSYRTPIKRDFQLKNDVYVFLGDANLAMHLVLSVIQKPSWYKKSVTLYCGLHDIKYAPWDGRENLIYIPSSKRTHPLLGINLDGGSTRTNHIGSLMLEINAIDDYKKPELPEFTHMSPLEVIRLSRAPMPSRLDLNWRMHYDDVTSTVKMSAVSVETGTTTDFGSRKRLNEEPSYLDSFLETWGLTI